MPGAKQKQRASSLGKRKREQGQTDLTLAEVREAVPALKKMLARWKDGKRQYGKRAPGDTALGYSQIQLLAERYLAGRNANREVDYERASRNMNFAMFRDVPDQLRAKEPEIIAYLRRALDEQRAIGADEHDLTSKDWSDRLAKVMEKHKAEIEKLKIELHESRQKKSATLQKTDTEDTAVTTTKLDAWATELKQKEKELATQSQEVSSCRSELVTQLDKQTRELQQQREVLEQQAQVLKQERANLDRQAEEQEQEHVRLEQWAQEQKENLDRQAEEQKQESADLGRQAEDNEHEREILDQQDREQKLEWENLDRQAGEQKQERARLEQQAQELKQEPNRQTGNESNVQRYEVTELEQQNRFMRLQLEVLDACCHTESWIDKYDEGKPRASWLCSRQHNADGL